MKNKKGFTLIELLAVIVVLAIIALIATPIVMNTIKNVKKGSAERTADNYIKQVETAVAESRIDGTKIANGNYNIQPDGNLCPVAGCGENDKDKIIIDMSGNKPTSGKIKITNGSVDQTSSTMAIGDYTVSYNSTKKTYEATEKGNSSSTVVYRWSTDGIKIGATIDPNDTFKFTKDPGTLERKMYLKHVLNKENKVTESYACAILKGKEYCLTNGEYGYAGNEADYTGNALLLKQIRDAKIEGISCSFSEDDSSCYDDSIQLYGDSYGEVIASTYGDASAYADAGICTVLKSGISYCAW